MYTRTAYVTACVSFLLAIGVVVSAQFAQGDEPAAAGVPVPISFEELRWTDLDPVGAPGVKIAVLWGDFKSGAFGSLFKLPAGFAAPLHTHTHEMKLVIVSGTYIQGPDGGQEFRLGPGSYLLQPGGNYRHTTRCDQASDCLFFVESKGAFDLRPVATGKPATP